ncbi:hypothetical protein [Hymenobacter sp. BT559]|uniref:hypothetical protein n=1 Tax=Hymenobacter sp. BT559 TaxID=2795729 RepID=UPI0018EBDA4E|nr:hypothetical protein [Hymenobacter sp. BT559]
MPQLVPFLLATQALLLSGQRLSTLLGSYHLPAPRAQQCTSRDSDQQLLGRITDQGGTCVITS